ncbi:aminopeptidase N [Kitasatospora paracochleata]|uniref:Aminopeptidase N n=1 Tax=Kitasatospora paracochleata TaxID=58354 RepID=A0ABT1ISF8_9ACTN|nr:aminopeptidase N [Kitasatospora paracochleata]MCP2308064.1 aminopeptidase N [Kitasatospora paracochleata]
MPALQRTEATLRAGLLDVRSYTVDLDLTRGGEVFGSTTVIRFDCAEPGADAFVDLEPAALHRVELNGRPLDPAGLDGNRLALPGLAAENELLVEAEMRYSRTGEGLHRYTDPADGEVYLYATCGPDLAPKVFACFDQPDLKAPITLRATLPPQWTAVANGAVTESADGRWEFAPTRPISTYLFTVVAGPLHSVRGEHDGIPLGLHARRSLAAELEREAEEIFEVTRASFDRLHELFDERYPFGEYHQAFVPEFNWGAMENPGCVVFRDEMLFRSEPTDADRESRAMVICHEMAHMWFGDLVTMRWWDDLWLNESFAEMLGYRVAAEATRFNGAWTGFAVKRKGWGYDADQRGSTHPVAGNGTQSVAEAVVNFDGISYAKGASVLRQLVAWLGDEAFFRGINAYFARHRYGNAELADFLAALAEASGRDVHGWAEAWLRTSGVDTLRVETERDSGKLRSVTVVNEGSRPHLIRVGAYAMVEPYLRAWPGAAVEVPAGGRVAVPELLDDQPELIVPNHGDLTWAKLRLDDRSREVLTASLGDIEDEQTRALLWEHARDLVRDGELTPAAYLEMVERHLPGESAVSIVEAVLAFAADNAAGRYLDPDARPDAIAVVSRTARALLRREGVGQSLRLAALRAAVESSANAADLDELRGWLVGEGLPAGLALSPELRWSAMARLAAKGAAGETEIAVELLRDPGTEAELGAARARAARSEPEAKERAWQEMFTDGTLSNHLLRATAEGFWRSGEEELQQRYVRRYFAELPGAGGRGDTVARVLGHALFPKSRATAETLALAEECLRQSELTPSVRRVLADETDDLRRAHRVRG